MFGSGQNIDGRVKALAINQSFDTDLAQEIFFQYEINLTSDGVDKMATKHQASCLL